MDLSDALFSPSKARQQQAQAKDWVFVESWLSRKYYPKPVPTFERNEETLQALMTLVAFNERADEERELLEKVERQALKELEEKVGLCISLSGTTFLRSGRGTTQLGTAFSYCDSVILSFYHFISHFSYPVTGHKS